MKRRASGGGTRWTRSEKGESATSNITIELRVKEGVGAKLGTVGEGEGGNRRNIQDGIGDKVNAGGETGGRTLGRNKIRHQKPSRGNPRCRKRQRGTPTIVKRRQAMRVQRQKATSSRTWPRGYRGGEGRRMAGMIAAKNWRGLIQQNGRT